MENTLDFDAIQAAQMRGHSPLVHSLLMYLPENYQVPHWLERANGLKTSSYVPAFWAIMGTSRLARITAFLWMKGLYHGCAMTQEHAAEDRWEMWYRDSITEDLDGMIEDLSEKMAS